MAGQVGSERPLHDIFCLAARVTAHVYVEYRTWIPGYLFLTGSQREIQRDIGYSRKQPCKLSWLRSISTNQATAVTAAVTLRSMYLSICVLEIFRIQTAVLGGVQNLSFLGFR